MMNKIFRLLIGILLIFFCFTPSISCWIIKDPSPGGLYIHNDVLHEDDSKLYYSPDYGETLYPKCAIEGGIYTADESLGVVYYANTGVGLNCSFDYGSTWIRRINQEVTSLTGGVEPGELYIWRGGFGILYSTDFGETFDTIGAGPAGAIVSGALNGEIYAFSRMETSIYFSSDYGETFSFINVIDSTVAIPTMRMASGPISGEIYVLNPTGKESCYLALILGKHLRKDIYIL
ncbi:hypothetical protein JXI42_01755 [bacterium]|nr:hypothetical protein [bacterium]